MILKLRSLKNAKNTLNFELETNVQECVETVKFEAQPSLFYFDKYKLIHCFLLLWQQISYSPLFCSE